MCAKYRAQEKFRVIISNMAAPPEEQLHATIATLRSSAARLLERAAVLINRASALTEKAAVLEDSLARRTEKPQLPVSDNLRT